ncbi:carbohydrate kinase family protein [Candidatus Falkowbacteria bacterium]|mgnify:CR=1 FL=1|jgi:sugar/nucleoside kinase (ribokinase family)|nr:carbohydrate kinase family protein [Candidatus Falkowbacteria bacterium]
MKYDFITIGGTTYDISFFTDQGVLIDNASDILRQKLLAFESGAKIKVDKFHYSFGGGAANAAACLANFGLRVACIAPIGNDDRGKLIKKNLQKRGINTSLIKKINNEESGSSFILISPDGERIIFAQRGANNKLVIGEKEIANLKKTKAIYIASLAGNWQANLKKIFSTVGPQGPQVFWNPGMTQLLGGVSKISKYLKKTTVFACNKDEALSLVVNSEEYKKTSHQVLNDTEKLIKIIHSFGPKIVVITLGKEGAVVYDGHQVVAREIIKERKTVDTTGVGDIFNSSFAAGWTLFDGNIDQALQLSLRNAAAKVAHIGAQNSLIKI